MSHQDSCNTNSTSNSPRTMRTFPAIHVEHIPYNVSNTDLHRNLLTPKQRHTPPSNSNHTSPTHSLGNQLYKLDPTLAIDLNNIAASSQDIDIDFNNFNHINNPFIVDEFKNEIDEIDHLIHAMTMEEYAPHNIPYARPPVNAITNQATSHSPPKSPSSMTRKKRKKKRPKRGSSRYHDVGYDPNPQYRAQGNIQISKSLTESIIPSVVKERHLSHVYTFMDKSYALSLNHRTHHHEGRIQIINYDFHSLRDNEALYCVMARQDGSTVNKSRGYKWRMVNKLYTAKDIEMEYGRSAAETLPSTWRNTERFANELLAGDEVKKVLMNESERERIINRCQWHKVRIFNRVNNKRRMTLSMTKPEFMRQCISYSHCLTQEEIQLIPILMFNKESNEYWIEHVWIVRIDATMDIGISFRYNGSAGVRVSGIHLDREYLAIQHELVLPQHECHCLQHFQSSISDLKIGNPDDLQNKINYYRQVIEELSRHKDEMREFMSIEPNNLYKFQSLQQRVGSSNSKLQSPKCNIYDVRHSNVYRSSNHIQYPSRSPSYSMNANHF